MNPLSFTRFSKTSNVSLYRKMDQKLLQACVKRKRSEFNVESDEENHCGKKEIIVLEKHFEDTAPYSMKLEIRNAFDVRAHKAKMQISTNREFIVVVKISFLSPTTFQTDVPPEAFYSCA